MYLIYRQNVAAELSGLPETSKELREFIKTTLFFYQIANEEILMNQLIKESTKFIAETKFSSAIELLSEANLMTRWREVYGSTILSSLAFANASQGNQVMA